MMSGSGACWCVRRLGISCPLLTGGVGGSMIGEEEAANWIVRLAANVDILCYKAVGVSKDDLRGIEWLNVVGRAVRDRCVIVDMQNVDEVMTIQRIMEDPKCLWLQVDVVGGG